MERGIWRMEDDQPYVASSVREMLVDRIPRSLSNGSLRKGKWKDAINIKEQSLTTALGI